MITICLCLIGASPAPFKLAPIKVEDLIKGSDAVVYGIPTSDPLTLQVGSIIVSKEKVSETRIQLLAPPPPDPNLFEQPRNYGVRGREIIFLTKPGPGSNKWKPVSYMQGSIILVKDRTESRETDVAAFDAKKPIYRCSVGYSILFPITLTPRGRNYATRTDLTREIVKISKIQALAGRHP